MLPDRNPYETGAASLSRGSGFRFFAALALAAFLAAPVWSHPSPSHTLDEINQHLEQSPNDPALLRAKTEALIELEKLDEAREITAQLLRAEPNSPDDLFLNARIALREGKSAEALDQAGNITEVAPDFAPGWNLRADLLYLDGKRDEAITAKQTAIEKGPSKNPSDYMSCATWLQERGKPGDAQAAIVVLDQGMSRCGLLTGLQQSAIAIDRSLGQLDSALHRLDTLIARLRPTADFAVERAEILTQAGCHAEAASAYDSAIAILKASPSWKKDPKALEQRVSSLQEQKQSAASRAAQTSARDVPTPRAD